MTSKKRLSAAKEHELATQLIHQQSAAMKASMDGMAILDTKGRYVYVNDAHAKIYGYDSAKELEGSNYRQFYAGEELKRLEEFVLPELWKTGAWRGELAGKRRDGAVFPQEISLTRVDGEDGKAAGFVAVVRDITERKLAELERARLLDLEKAARTEAETASRSKDEFLAVVSHELRTPMTAILGWTWLLRSGDVAPEELNKALEVIERNMKLQAQIIEDLLDVSSIVTGKLHLQAKPLQISSVIRAAIDTARSAADAKRVAIECAVVRDVAVKADAHRLQQVFWNLLSNAVKFNHEGGRARVLVEQKGDFASVTISDDGQGIEPSLLPEVFDPFRQGEDSLTRQFRGLGLGLAIVRHLVQMHGGSVAASSAGVGKGSSFTVLLPVLSEVPRALPPPPSALAASSPVAALIGSLTGAKILVVDDETDTLSMLSELLAFCGADVSPAASAQIAYGLLAKVRPEIVVSDLAMPHEDGYTFIKRVRAHVAEGRAIKALALSAHARQEDRQNALAAGYDLYLSKPVEPAQLVAALRSLLKSAK